jgi:stage IV sporulation protein FB
MNDRLSGMLLSFTLLRLKSLRIRVSLYFLLFAAMYAFRLGWSLGLTLIGILFLSVLVHELGHVFAARLTGGSASEIHLTPVGGVAPVQPGRGLWPHILTAAAGPFVNLLACLAVFPSYYAPETLWGVLNPLYLPVGQLQADQLARDLGLIAFWMNWVLLLINLLPILPLDGGQIVRALLATKIHPELVDRTVVKCGIVASAFLMITGVWGDWSLVVALGAVLLILNMIQLFDEQTADNMEDSFLGYDFSEGYTSLERSAPAPAQPREAPPGLLQRWRERRRLRREREERRQQEEAERQLDGLLAKVHERGMASLTAGEQRLLRQVSDLLRERGKRAP